ncbi:MAG: hypothetical protein JW908_04270 [Anaerolineales bacterium]|nr:hypothetical protein [Anaerolineales bacterium]
MTSLLRHTGAASGAQNRRSIRLKGYDYTHTGAYFITICACQREWLFGEIVNGEMQLNTMGQIVENEWAKTQQLRPDVELGPFVIMPNHFHGIIWIVDGRGTARRAPTADGNTHHNDQLHTVPTVDGNIPGGDQMYYAQTDGTARLAPTAGGNTYHNDQLHHTPAIDGNPTHEQFGKPVVGSIPTIVRAFKSAATRQINLYRNTPGALVWQRNYYEHVIRDEKSYNQIAEYILNNPLRWELDTLYSGGIS